MYTKRSGVIKGRRGAQAPLPKLLAVSKSKPELPFAHLTRAARAARARDDRLRKPGDNGVDIASPIRDDMK